jgi:hypothetical protein
MQLHLRVEFSDAAEDEPVFDDVLTSFDEQERIGLVVGRAVRDWLRRIPHRRQPTRATVHLEGIWDESTPRATPKRSKKAKAEDADGG